MFISNLSAQFSLLMFVVAKTNQETCYFKEDELPRWNPQIVIKVWTQSMGLCILYIAYVLIFPVFDSPGILIS